MRYDEFVAEFGVPVDVPKGTLRKWKFRQSVPLEYVTAARNAKTVPLPVPLAVENVPSGAESVPSEGQSVPCTENVRKKRSAVPQDGNVVATSVPSVELTVAIPSFEKGHPEFDIMSDGWARGFPGDRWQRVNRTAHGIRRMAEVVATDQEVTPLCKTMVAEWNRLREDCPEGDAGNACRVAVLERVSKMMVPDKKFAVTSGGAR